MKRSKRLLFVMGIVAIAARGFAGDGHDHSHDAPGVKAKITGAQIKGNETLFVEVLYQDKNIKFYPFTKEQVPMALSTAKFSASLELPKKKDLQPLALIPHNDHFMAAFDAKGLHRFTVVLKTEDGHSDIFKYTFETRK